MAKAKRKASEPATASKTSKTSKLGKGQALQLLGVVAAMFIAVVANVLAARHYTRWDWTKGHRYSLTPATLETLHDLSDTVEIWVLAGSADPLEQSIKQTLVEYQ